MRRNPPKGFVEKALICVVDQVFCVHANKARRQTSTDGAASAGGGVGSGGSPASAVAASTGFSDCADAISVTAKNRGS